MNQQNLVEETKILAKVNAAHREAFYSKYPGQIEHCLRLSVERLNISLLKRDGIDIHDVESWRFTTTEIHELAQTVYLLEQIRRGL
jgi:hypothetical protein